MARHQAGNQEAIEDYRAKAADLHDLQTTMLIKLRMNAPLKMVKTAEALHEADHAVTAGVLITADMTSEDNWSELRSRQRAARKTFIDAGRQSLGFGPGAPIVHSHLKVDDIS